MLLTDIVRVGEPLVTSDMTVKERIQLLTDVGKDTVKNFYGNVFIVHLQGKEATFHYRSYQDEENGEVNINAAIAMPITLPAGGNPNLAQGIYPISSYPMYNAHIKGFTDLDKTTKVVYDRFARTLTYADWEDAQVRDKASIVAQCLHEKASFYIEEDRQLGVLFIVDESLSIFSTEQAEQDLLLHTNFEKKMYVDSAQMIKNIIETRFQEAKELGFEKDTTSTISNETSAEVVSAYNKAWLWLSPTWEAPRSIYWRRNEFTKGIRLNRKEYEQFYYGSQFLKQIQTPIRAALLKEMFAPTHSVEAKQNMNATSFESIYGIPYFLPLTERPAQDLYAKYDRLRRKFDRKEVQETDIHLEMICGLQDRAIAQMSDEYRITIIYYSGNLNRGDIHIRSQIEDIVPSVVQKIQAILRELNRRELTSIARKLNIPNEQLRYTKFKVEYLPSLLSNAYGPGYLWMSMENVLRARPIQLQRVMKQTVERVRELANKKDFWGIRFELLFYHLFASFYSKYNEQVLQKNEGGDNMQQWEDITARYVSGDLCEEDFNTAAKVGFITGCIVQQFERSYFAKVQKSYLDTRVMRFGSKLTPKDIWKKGLIEMETLRRRWDFGIANNYMKALALTLQAMIRLDEEHALTKEKDEFMTMFWSGYLMLPKREET